MAQLQSSIGDVLITKFSNTVFELANQTSARTKPCVEMVQMEGEMLMIPRVGSVEAQELNERYPEIIPADLLWDNRRISASRFGVPMFVDEWDAHRMLADPNSVLAMRAAQAIERKFDRVVIAALTAPAFTGRQGTVQIAAATDGVVTINATGGFTYDTLLQINENFQSVEIGTEAPVKKWLYISEQEHAKLMREGTLISGDFSKQYAVDKGKMVSVLDFEIIVFGSAVPVPMLNVTSNVRTCFAVCSGAVKVGVNKQYDVKVKERNDRWDTTQVLASGRFGAARIEGARVQIIQTTPGQ